MFSAEKTSGLNTTTASPRLSFSLNLDNSMIENYPYRSDSNSDFDFCISSQGFDNEASSADELFRDGLIRPSYTEEKQLVVTNTSKNISSLSSVSFAAGSRSSKKESAKEIILVEGCEQEQKNQQLQLKSFWSFKRSNSLHCESTNKKSSFWSSLPLLSRSKSAGSVLKDHLNKQNMSQKQSNNSSMAIYSSSSSSSSFSSQKPPLKRNYGGAYDYGVRISPVLNVPPPFISKSAANLLGLGSFFRNCKDKKNKK